MSEPSRFDDLDPEETREWLESIDSVIKAQGAGRAHFLLERLIDYINGHDGIRWATMEEIADDFVQRYPRSQPNHDPGINMYGVETPAAEGASS